MTLLSALLLYCTIVPSLTFRTFESHVVLRIPTTTRSHIHFFHNLFYNNNTLDFWTEPRHLGQVIDVRLDPAQRSWFSDELEKRGMVYEVLIEDLEKLRLNQIQGRKVNSVGFDYGQYHTYEEIVEWLKTLPYTYPKIASLVNLGKSYEGRELLAVRISSNKTSNPKAIWFDGGIHAREWISTATVVYMLGKMLEDYEKDEIVTQIIDSAQVFVLPVFNPDGYTYTWTDDRMWRKTRSPNSGSDCVGTDPNRNWDFKWGGAGASDDPCSESYQGPSAFSEIEVKTVGYFIKNKRNFVGYINFHSYSQLWMSPWGYTDSLPHDYKAQNALGAKSVSALSSLFQTQYQYGTISNIIYPASGCSADYTYYHGVTYSYGVELRDTGDYGFLLPADQIIPSGQETYEAIKVWAQTSLGLNK